MNEDEAPAPLPELPPPPEDKPEPVNRSALVRDCIRRHPDWTYGQIGRWVKEKTGLSITKSTIHRAMQSSGRVKGKPSSKGAGLIQP